jgi:hypothetical protein
MVRVWAELRAGIQDLDSISKSAITVWNTGIVFLCSSINILSTDYCSL